MVSFDKICKRCLFECDMKKYSTCSMNKVWACAVFSHIARKMNNVCIFSHDQVTHDIKLPYIVLNLQLERDMGWYRHTSHSENHSIECDKSRILSRLRASLCRNIATMCRKRCKAALTDSFSLTLSTHKYFSINQKQTGFYPPPVGEGGF